MKTITTISAFFLLLGVYAQEIKQTVRGTIIDQISEAPIPGAKIFITSSETPLRAISDSEGKFTIKDVPIGRHDLMVTYLGYENAIMSGILVDAGKETVLTIALEERITEKDAVKVEGKRRGPASEMSEVSTRTFTMEETQRYAAGLNDPARMATSFAGVVSTQGINNDISVRGNSPRGLIWRMEGAAIPNPNHFSGVGTSGGGISIISAQLMGTSDFSTGAFAAEYGNALSGVFDLYLRKGNNQKREYTFQAGLLGIDAAIEGPFKKGYDGSYLVNYRYSTLSLLNKFLPLGDNETNFQDLSFNFHLPTSKFGNFGIYGFGGLSDDSWEPIKDTVLWETEPWYRYSGVFIANTGMVGIKHSIRAGNSGIFKSNAVISATYNGQIDDTLDNQFNVFHEFEESFIQKSITLSSNYTHKFSSKTNGKIGAVYTIHGFELTDRYWQDGISYDRLNESGQSATVQAFAQVGYKISQKLKVNAGVHFLEFLLNKTYSVEPRFSMAYQMKPKHRLSLGYGLHSQMQPIGSYFAKVTLDNGMTYQPNKNLELNKAHHIVAAYNWKIDEKHSLRIEAYYQHLFDIPVGAKEDSTFSLVNDDFGFETSQLQSTGKGRNYGIELTFDRKLENGLYYLISGSYFFSEYEALNKKWYPTVFNTNFSFACTAGKEWEFKNKEKPRSFAINIKSTTTGGMRYTPLDPATIGGGNYPDLDYDRSFSENMPFFNRTDIRISLKRQYKKVTSTISLDAQNALNRENVAGQYYDTQTNEVKYYHSTGIIPVMSYRLTF